MTLLLTQIPNLLTILGLTKSYFFMPKYFTALLSLFLLFVIALSTVGAYYVYENTRPTSTISVTDILKQKVKPDQATVQLFISQSGTDIKKMNTENDAVTVKVTDYLVQNGVAKNKIKTNKNSYKEDQVLDLENPLFNGNEKAFTQIITRVESIIDVEFVNFDDNPNAILDGTLALGVNRYGQFNYKTKDLKAICDQMEIDVEKSVKVKADQKIKNLGGTVVKTQYGQTYTTGCDNSLGGMTPMYDAKSAAMGGAIPNILTGEQEVSATANLNVEYR
jgi:uncharacterized protein YggE